MSSGQKHRDPWNFPCMKWRAWKRLSGSQRLAVVVRSQRRARGDGDKPGQGAR